MTSTPAHHTAIALPDYVVINDETQDETLRAVLRTPSKPVQFPLSDEDKADLDLLCAKYDQEENIAGLAAPQIGIPKQMIIFATSDDPRYKKFRPDLTQTLGRTIWLNPSYEPLTTETRADYEGCFSVGEIAGEVNRYTKIRVAAKTPTGDDVDFVAEGFLARIIQHEIDHVHGILFIDKANEGSIMSIEAYREKRRKAMEDDTDTAEQEGNSN